MRMEMEESSGRSGGRVEQEPDSAEPQVLGAGRPLCAHNTTVKEHGSEQTRLRLSAYS